MDGVKIVDNDGNAQMATQKCASTSLTAGAHTLYVEGWSKSDALSSVVTYAGPDTENQTSTIQAAISPRAPSPSGPVFRECDAREPLPGNNNFTICAFKANNYVDLQTVDDVSMYYKQVSSYGVNLFRCR